jgi:tetratricopeptide (TPR) repeat protein
MDYRIQQLRYQLREDPASRYFFQLGELLRKQGELDEAAEILERGLEIHPRYVAAWVALGRTRQSAGDLVTAEEAFARALELDPEHGVAARLIGETAMARGDEIRAVTAFKLARALLGPDSELEERIADLETRTLIHGEALTDPPAASDAVEAPFAEPDPPPNEPAAEPDVFFVEEDPAEAGDPFDLASDEDPWRPRPGVDDIVAVGDDDPFAVVPTGQTGVFVLGDDVFTDPPAEKGPEDDDPMEPDSEEPASPDVFTADPDSDTDVWSVEEDVAETPSQGSIEPVDEVFAAPDDDLVAAVPEAEPEPLFFDADADADADADVGTPIPDEALAVDVPDEVHTEEPVPDEPPMPVVETGYPELEVVPEFAEMSDDAAPEPDHDADGPLPVPTLTLARLAWEQDDLPLAERTLEALLERNPDDGDAADFLELVRNRPRPPQMAIAEPAPVTEQSPASTADALQGWLQRFRLAAERSRP